MTRSAAHDLPIPRGDHNENPRDIGLLSLLLEDFRTHGSSAREPGFWAVALHRIGNARMGVRPKVLRAPLTAFYDVGFWYVEWFLGINLSYTVKLGRRVRIWHHGGIVLSARSIGDDTHIRHNTTFGIARKNETEARPVIGRGVDIGTGACILGAVTVGDGSVIGAGSIVVHDVPAGATVVGSPARPVRRAPAIRTVREPDIRESGVHLLPVRVGRLR